MGHTLSLNLRPVLASPFHIICIVQTQWCDEGTMLGLSVAVKASIGLLSVLSVSTHCQVRLIHRIVFRSLAAFSVTLYGYIHI